MSEDDLREEIRKLSRSLHGVGKPWYARSPWKEIVAHAAAVVTAVGIGLVVHKWTGAPVVIEAKNAAPAAASIAEITSAMDRVEIELALLDAAAPVSTAVAAEPILRSVVRPVRVDNRTAAAPAAAPAAIPPPAAATAKPAVVRSVQVGAVRVGD